MNLPLLSRIEAHANAMLDELRAQGGIDVLPGVCGADLLHERARLMALAPQGQRSANGSCHLLPCRDGEWIAISLARPSDWTLLPALLGQEIAIENVDQLASHLVSHRAKALVAQGSLLGLAIAQARRPEAASLRTNEITVTGKPQSDTGAKHTIRAAPLRVVDLSTLWAGPLCSRLLLHTGAHVTEVHNVARPDGMMLNTAPGAQEFYRRLHDGKQRCEFDFRRPEEIERLRKLLEDADIVIESARPRALRQLGIDAEQWVHDSAGKIWISITGYGRNGEQANRIAFGDDAAIGAGVFAEENGSPVFIGDAIADPLAGIRAALLAQRHAQHGTGALLDISLHDAAAMALQ